MNVLEVKNLRKSFEDNIVLNNLSLTVPDHTATVLIGASGSGKSTLLRCINLLDTIDDGSIYLDGKEISDPEINVDEVRKGLGMVFQSFNLFPHMSVLDNITLSPIRVHKVSKTQARDEAMTLLRRFDLADKADQYPDRLSGGQQQQLAIARALISEPKVLLLDEPSLGLAPTVITDVFERLQEIIGMGTAVVIVEQRANLVTSFAEKTIVIRDGRVQATLTPADAANSESLQRSYFGAGE